MQKIKFFTGFFVLCAIFNATPASALYYCAPQNLNDHNADRICRNICTAHNLHYTYTWTNALPGHGPGTCPQYHANTEGSKCECEPTFKEKVKKI